MTQATREVLYQMGAHRSPRWIVFVFACLLAALPPIAASQSHAAGAYGKRSARPVSMASVRYIYHGLTVRPPHKRSRHGKVPDKLYPAYGLDTGRKQKASIQFIDKTLLHLNQSTSMVLSTPSTTKVKHGEVYEQLIPGTKHTVQTASGIGA